MLHPYSGGGGLGSTGAFRCRLCGQPFPTQRDLCTHTGMVHPSGGVTKKPRYKCPYCSYTAMAKRKVVGHLALHSNAGHGDGGADSERLLGCVDCDYAVLLPHVLARHRKMVHGVDGDAAKQRVMVPRHGGKASSLRHGPVAE